MTKYRVITCPDCNGLRHVLWSRPRIRCIRCKGTGEIKKKIP